MNSMNDQRFFDLAMKVIAQQATGAERAELATALEADPNLRTEFERLQAQAGLVREVVPLVNTVEARAGQFPAYARERLQTKVRETLGRPNVQERKPHWASRLFLVLAPAAATVLVLVFVVFGRPATPTIQVAMLDLAGISRGAETNEQVMLRQQWPSSTVRNFDKQGDLDAWEKTLPVSKGMVVIVVYDRSAGEIRVSGQRAGREFRRSFPVERDLASVLKLAEEFIKRETR